MASVFVGGCGAHEEPLGPTATFPQATTTTNPYAVPAVIDEAYVNRVLSGLDHAIGDIARIIARERTISPAVVDRLRALYGGQSFDLMVASLEADQRGGFSTYRDEPGDQDTIVTRVIRVSPSCVFVEAARDYSAVSSDPEAGTNTVWVSLRPAASGAVNHELNPTGWMITYDGFQKGRKEPPDPCVEPS